MLGDDLLIGEKVRLGSLSKEYLPLYAKWFSTDYEMMRQLGSMIMVPQSKEDEEKWYDGAFQQDNAYHFAVFPKEADNPIGGVTIEIVDWPARWGILGLFIGDANYRGRGFGTDITRLIVRFGFMELNLHRISLDVFSYNQRAIATYKKVGFTEEGRRRAKIWRDGQPHDVLNMSILRHEWKPW